MTRTKQTARRSTGGRAPRKPRVKKQKKIPGSQSELNHLMKEVEAHRELAPRACKSAPSTGGVMKQVEEPGAQSELHQLIKKVSVKVDEMQKKLGEVEKKVDQLIINSKDEFEKVY